MLDKIFKAELDILFDDFRFEREKKDFLEEFREYISHKQKFRFKKFKKKDPQNEIALSGWAKIDEYPLYCVIYRLKGFMKAFLEGVEVCMRQRTPLLLIVSSCGEKKQFFADWMLVPLILMRKKLQTPYIVFIKYPYVGSLYAPLFMIADIIIAESGVCMHGSSLEKEKGFVDKVVTFSEVKPTLKRILSCVS